MSDWPYDPAWKGAYIKLSVRIRLPRRLLQMIGLLSSRFRTKNPPEKQEQVRRFTQERVGLLCTEELNIATEKCRKKVEAIAKNCRARNRRFRDVEFDVEEDKERCLHGLATPDKDRYTPADVMRVHQIFDKPKFFINGANWSDITQGVLGDCWFLSALATVSTIKDLIEKICVARDEQVGVYGFVFYRDCGWVEVVVDDLLFVSIPKYEELAQPQKNIYHHDKEKFNANARKGSKSLYFARSGTENETWVPLLEKAYAKLHGDYAAIDGGHASDAIEDLTGGVSTVFHVHDILDTDKFWEDELSKVNQGRLFGCYLYRLAGGVQDDIEINGLLTGHAYSVISATEINGKRFLRVRNPWGDTEWTGAWSDGSKEWTREWLDLLPKLGHKFGNDGEFLMEYSDFLNTWTMIERSKLFDKDWKMSSIWLNVRSRKFPCAWNYGDVSFTFSVKENGPAVIVLSKLDNKYFAEISGQYDWTLEFVIYRKDAPASEPYASSAHTVFWHRSVNVELDDLEAGDYVVHVRLDRAVLRNPVPQYPPEEVSRPWDLRKLSKVRTEACISNSIAINFDPKVWDDVLPADVNTYGGQDLTAIELAHHEESQKKTTPDGTLGIQVSQEPAPIDESAPGSEVVVNLSQSPTPPAVPLPESPADVEDHTAEVTNTNTGDEDSKSDTFEDAKSDRTEGETGDVFANNEQSNKVVKGSLLPPSPGPASPGGWPTIGSPAPMGAIHHGWSCDECGMAPIIGPRHHCLNASCLNYNLCSSCMKKGVHNPSHELVCILNVDEGMKLHDNAVEGEDNSITLGLRVYTKGGSAATVGGQLRHGTVIGWKKKSTN